MGAKSKLMLSIVLFLLLFGIAIFAYQLLSNQYKPNDLYNISNEENLKMAPDFVMYSHDGKQVKLSDYIGMPLVLNFWASWCPPCKGEMPHFEEAYQQVKDHVMFIMVDLVDGQRETMEKGKKYIAENGYTFPVFYDTEQDAARAYGIRAIPTTIAIDRQGYIVKTLQGGIDQETLYEVISLIK